MADSVNEDRPIRRTRSQSRKKVSGLSPSSSQRVAAQVAKASDTARASVRQSGDRLASALTVRPKSSTGQQMYHTNDFQDSTPDPDGPPMGSTKDAPTAPNPFQGQWKPTYPSSPTSRTPQGLPPSDAQEFSSEISHNPIPRISIPTTWANYSQNELLRVIQRYRDLASPVDFNITWSLIEPLYNLNANTYRTSQWNTYSSKELAAVLTGLIEVAIHSNLTADVQLATIEDLTMERDTLQTQVQSLEDQSTANADLRARLDNTTKQSSENAAKFSRADAGYRKYHELYQSTKNELDALKAQALLKATANPDVTSTHHPDSQDPYDPEEFNPDILDRNDPRTRRNLGTFARPPGTTQRTAQSQPDRYWKSPEGIEIQLPKDLSKLREELSNLMGYENQDQKMSAPKAFSGDRMDLHRFFTTLLLHFQSHGKWFQEPRTRAAFIFSRCEGTANTVLKDPAGFGCKYDDDFACIYELWQVFGDRNAFISAQSDWDKLTFPWVVGNLTAIAAWSTFRADFENIAARLDWSYNTRAYNLYEKLPPMYRNQLGVNWNPDCPDAASWRAILNLVDRAAITVDMNTRITNSRTPNPRQAAPRTRTPAQNTRVSGDANQTRRYNPDSPKVVTPRTPASTHPSGATGRNFDKPSHDKTPTDDRVCYHCQKPGHLKNNCPDLPAQPHTANQRQFHTDQYCGYESEYDTGSESEYDSGNALP
jgi:hypothetical protein